METLWNLYQQRLTQLNTQFIHLLSEFENNQLFTTPQLAKYRVEYLASVLEKTLKNNQQQLILKLYQQIHLLSQTNHQLRRSLNHQTHPHQHQEFTQKSLGSTKVSTIHYHTDKDQTDSFLDTCSSKFGKKNHVKPSIANGKTKLKQSSKTSNQKISKRPKNSQESQQQEAEMEMMKMSFKYLKL